MTEPDPHRAYTIVGGGAIGGTLGFYLARAGHPVRIVDTDPDHVAAIRERGLRLRTDAGDLSVGVEAVTPDAADGTAHRVLLCVKAQATEAAVDRLAPGLAPDGFVVSVQNGLNESVIAARIGAERTVGAFVDLFADVVEPGVIHDGGAGALVVGEMTGQHSTRVAQTVADLRAWGPAEQTANVSGYLWAKLGFGAMLSATALADAPMGDLIDRYRPLMYRLAGEVFAVARTQGVALEPFDAFDPAAYLPDADAAERERATDRLVDWLRGQAKDRSGIWRDIAVRHRPVEVHDHYAPVFAAAEASRTDAPLVRAMLTRLAAVEHGHAMMSEDHLTELASHRSGGYS